jgi:hypothetical protein
MSQEALASLRRIREAPRAPEARPGEVCEMCAQPIADAHNHIVDVESRNLMCTCRGCWLLFTARGAGGGHFKAVPERYESVPELARDNALWEALDVPVGVAFFFRNSALDRVCAFYPSPAGATESMLALETWEAVAAARPELATLDDDVEALLVRLDRDAPEGSCFIVPIDCCYELVGILRSQWRGFDGGQEARDSIDAFFTEIRLRAR